MPLKKPEIPIFFVKGFFVALRLRKLRFLAQQAFDSIINLLSTPSFTIALPIASQILA